MANQVLRLATASEAVLAGRLLEDVRVDLRVVDLLVRLIVDS